MDYLLCRGWTGLRTGAAEHARIDLLQDVDRVDRIVFAGFARNIFPVVIKLFF